MIKKVFMGVGLLLIVTGIFVYKLYTREHRMVEQEQYTSMNAQQLFLAFEENEAQANTKFLNQVIEVKGVISEVLTNQENNTVVVLKSNDPLFGISCTLEQPTIRLREGDSLIVKGICTGFLSDVVLTDCIIIKP
jgi:hypothetical protein